MPPHSTATRARAVTTAQPQAEAAIANVESAKRASILARVATRFNMDPNGFANTLRSTVFKGASNEEFAALLVVADTYGLNPLTKEMYAFPQKGGGIVPLVSIDGWIRIMNDHPQFDGIEFTDIPDENGGLIAIEAIIYRKDRSRPIRVTEYLDECKRNTDPWNKSPARMLRHRSLIQCARIAFGFSGIYTDDDVIGEVRLGGDIAPSREVAPMRNVTPADRQIEQQANADAQDVIDPETGEIVDAQEGPSEQQRGEQHVDPDTGREIDPQEAKAQEIVDRAKALTTIIDYNKLAEDVQPHIDAMSDADMAGACNKALRDAKKRLTQQ